MALRDVVLINELSATTHPTHRTFSTHCFELCMCFHREFSRGGWEKKYSPSVMCRNQTLTRQGLDYSPCTTFRPLPFLTFLLSIQPSSWAYWSIPGVVMVVCINLMCLNVRVPVSQSTYVAALWIDGIIRCLSGIAVGVWAPHTV